MTIRAVLRGLDDLASLLPFARMLGRGHLARCPRTPHPRLHCRRGWAGQRMAAMIISPTSDAALLDLGHLAPGDEAHFDVPHGALGLARSSSTATCRATTRIGVQELRDPSGAIVVSEMLDTSHPARMLAGSNGGRFILRLDDTDRERSRRPSRRRSARISPGSASTPDEEHRQSARFGHYEAALARLRGGGARLSGLRDGAGAGAQAQGAARPRQAAGLRPRRAGADRRGPRRGSRRRGGGRTGGSGSITPRRSTGTT